MSYTQGPWIVVGELRDEDEVICDLVNQTWVVKGHRLPLGHWRDDARLISSVHDLLAQLKTAAKTLRKYEELHRAKGTEESTAKAEVNAELAKRFEESIYKATGETP